MVAVAVIAGAGNRLYTSFGGGEFNPGNAYFTDDFDYAVGRDDSYASKSAAFEGAGWGELSDYTLNPNRGGWFYTRTAAQAASDLGYTGGAFPFPVDRALVIEADPNLSDYDGPGIGRQTNHFLLHEDWRPRIWWQYWEYIVSGTRSQGDKLWYPADWIDTGSGTNNGFYLTIDGRRSYEQHNPLHDSGERAVFASGDAPNDETYHGFRAAGLTGEGILTNSNSLDGQEDACPQNVDATPQQMGEWVLHKFFVDHTGAQGKFGHWVRRVGGEWVQLAYFEGGVTPGFSWPIPEAFRNHVQQMKTPTTVNQHPPTEDTDAEGAHIKMWGYLQFADDEEDLATFADEPS